MILTNTYFGLSLNISSMCFFPPSWINLEGFERWKNPPWKQVFERSRRPFDECLLKPAPWTQPWEEIQKRRNVKVERLPGRGLLTPTASRVVYRVVYRSCVQELCTELCTGVVQRSCIWMCNYCLILPSVSGARASCQFQRVSTSKTTTDSTESDRLHTLFATTDRRTSRCATVSSALVEPLAVLQRGRISASCLSVTLPSCPLLDLTVR